MFETDVPEIIVLQLLLVVGSPLGVAIAANASSAEILVFDNDELPSTTTTLEPTELTTTPPPQTTTTTDSTPVVTMPTISKITLHTMEHQRVYVELHRNTVQEVTRLATHSVALTI